MEAGWLMRKHPDDAHMRVSHETTCKSLFIQTHGVLKRELVAHPKAKRSIRRPGTPASKMTVWAR